MKKRNLSALFIAMTLLLLSACRVKSPQKEDADITITTDMEKDKVEEVTTTTIAITTSTTPKTMSDNTTIKAESEDVRYVLNCNRFKNGYLTFEMDDTYYVCDVQNKNFYSYDADVYDGAPYGIKGELAIFENYIYYGPSEISILFNLKTGEIIASKEKNDIMPYCLHYDIWDNFEYICVLEEKESFSGNTTFFGVLDAKGEWVLPLSDEYSICEIVDLKSMYLASGYGDKIYVIDASTNIGYIYSITTNKLYNLKETTGCESLRCIYDNKLLVYNPYDDLMVYDINTGKAETLIDIEKGCELFINSLPNCEIYYSQGYEKRYFIDYELNRFDYDLSEYDVVKIYDADRDKIVFTANNKEETEYIVIMNADGSFVIEPFKYDDAYDIQIYGNKVIGYVNNKLFMVDCITGTMTDFIDLEYKIELFDQKTGAFLVESKIEGYREAYFLINVEDPYTLINPLEMAG